MKGCVVFLLYWDHQICVSADQAVFEILFPKTPTSLTGFQVIFYCLIYFLVSFYLLLFLIFTSILLLLLFHVCPCLQSLLLLEIEEIMMAVIVIRGLFFIKKYWIFVGISSDGFVLLPTLDLVSFSCLLDEHRSFCF